MENKTNKIAVVIPCYKVSKHIVGLISSIGPEVSAIFVVDDNCPEGSGKLVSQEVKDPRVKVIYHQNNLGVGGAVITGYRAANEAGCTIIVKIDGDGQMDPALIPSFVAPIENGLADYSKGNRFFAWKTVARMPVTRLIGNTLISFVSKATSGYWDLMDPTNGYTAIHSAILPFLPLDRIERRYFFESDMLFRLNTIRAVVYEVPMQAIYEDEISNLSILKALFEFPPKYFVRLLKRITYNYFLRDFNAASLQLITGSLLFSFGVIFGSYHWWTNLQAGVATPTGTIILALLPTIVGFQLLLSALNYDVANIPRRPLHLALSKFSHKIYR